MQFLIVSGLSGAGKSKAASTLEDMGFYCVDNMPADLIPQFARLCLATTGRYDKVALVTDVRGGQTFDGLFKALSQLDEMHCAYTIVFIEASTQTIINRYKETRRTHPLSKDGTSLAEAVERERQLLEPVRTRAGHVINTTGLSTARLRRELLRLFSGDTRERAMSVNVVSFGFKYGLPRDADLVFDVRFLPNPYYIAELREKSGLEPEVREFVFSYQQTLDFVQKVEDLLAFTLPHYMEEGKTSLVIAIGCTGGHHRSVAIAKELSEFIAKRGYATVLRHRDMHRDGENE